MTDTYLYYGTSPYHTLLSLSIARDETDAEHCLLLTPRFPGSDALVTALRDWDACPIDTIRTLSNTHGYRLPRVWMERSKHSLQARKFVKRTDPDRIFVAKDTGATEQSLLHHASTETTCTYIEDGTVAYSSSKLSPKPVWKRIAGKLFYGPWWTPPEVIGTTEWIDRIAVTFPGHVRPELRETPRDRIHSSPLREMNREWIRTFFNSIDVTDSCHKIDHLVLATHSEVARSNPNYRRTMADLLAEKRGKIGVKYHPRETEGDYLGVESTTNATVLPQSIPAELLYLMADRLGHVTGTISTALLTAKWLDSDLEVTSLIDVLDIENARLATTFRSIGIRVI